MPVLASAYRRQKTLDGIMNDKYFRQKLISRNKNLLKL